MNVLPEAFNLASFAKTGIVVALEFGLLHATFMGGLLTDAFTQAFSWIGSTGVGEIFNGAIESIFSAGGIDITQYTPHVHHHGAEAVNTAVNGLPSFSFS